MMKKIKEEVVTLSTFAVGGQALGALQSGKKVFVWGGLPGETVRIRLGKQKSSWAEGVVTEVITASESRVKTQDGDSYLSTSPWQILDTTLEDATKHALVRQAFSQHRVELPDAARFHQTDTWYGYRNKVEFSFYFDTERDVLELGFFQRGGRGKLPVQGTSLARPEINDAALRIRDALRRNGVEGRSLKTLLLRSQQNSEVVAQLYVKDRDAHYLSHEDIDALDLKGMQIIYSNPLSPASVITKVLHAFGDTVLQDQLLGVPFRYACEGFFQVNLPVYASALKDMAKYIDEGKPTVDMYSGVGTIGLTIGMNTTTLVEENPTCVAEMAKNIETLKRDAHAVLATSESALEHIISEANLILDPPRAGLHSAVVDRILEVRPPRILYLSCNPSTQGRDAALLLANGTYRIKEAVTYNFFPRTPHIEHLLVLERA